VHEAGHARAVHGATALWVVGAKHHAGYTGVGQGCHAHRAGFERDGQRAACEKFIANLGQGLVQTQHFSVLQGVLLRLHQVMGTSENLAAGVGNHGPNWHFAFGQCHTGLSHRGLHEGGWVETGHSLLYKEYMENARPPERPTIGIIMDWQEKGSFSPRPHYAIRESYFHAVWAMGGLPIGLPLIEAAQSAMLGQVQGIVVPGGDYPSPSRWYDDGHGIGDEHPRTIQNEALIRELLVRRMPLLGICAGMQELVAATGGLLHWRVAESVGNPSAHRSIAPTEIAHVVQVAPHTLLHRLTGQAEFGVNSHHNEGVKTLGEGLQVAATAPDGLIEAVEVVNHPFALGVQWHPEFLLSEADRAIFDGLVNAARAYAPAAR
jgi:putative glutamine amidotransferase